MLDTLLNFISEQKLFQRDQKILLAVSGGVDSMVMEHLFRKAGFNYAIAHCNFNLRGKSSDEDQLMVQKTAAKNKTQLFINSFTTEDYASQNNISIQMAARELRKTWMEDLRSSKGFDFIATAHHINDSVETAIFNLAKGTGISGLKGIAAASGLYIRPMMFASRKLIYEYATENRISWREDQSNSSTKYSRNLIRHEVVPALRKINPKLEDTFRFTSERVFAAERIYKNAIRQFKEAVLSKQGLGFGVDKAKLRSLVEGKMVLLEIMKDFGFNFHQANDVYRALDGQPGKQFYSDEFLLTIDRDNLLIDNHNQGVTTKLVVEKDIKSVNTSFGAIQFDEIEKNNVSFTGDDNVAFVDFDKLEFPLKIRNWEQGDYFRPLGMKHKKKLSDFMIDEKFALNLKKQLLLLISGDNVVWVVGHRIDDRYKLTDKTKRVYRICKTIKDDKSI